MRRAAFPGALGLLALLLAPAPAARAWCRMTTESSGFGCSRAGVPLAWPRRCIALSIDGRYAGGVDEELARRAVDYALAAWSGVPCEDGERVQIVLGRDRRPARCRKAEFSLEDGNVSVVAFVEDWAEQDLDPLAYALTTVWHDSATGEILDADVMVNATRGPYAWCPEATGCLPPSEEEQADVDLPNTLVHEVGHVLGLSHSEVPEATMAGEAPRGEIRKRTLEADDRAGLCAAYPPGSLPETCDFTPFGGFDRNCEDDGEGCTCRIERERPPGSLPDGLLAALLLGGALRWRRRRATARRAPG